MMSEDLILEQVIASPKLSLYAEHIQSVLQVERKKRAQFYETVSSDDKVEFINGEIIYHSPVKLQHNVAQKLLLKLLDTYVQLHSLGFVGHEKLLIALSRNDYEPDVCFFTRQKAVSFTPRQDRFPAPDFIAEVLSESTASRDRGVKFEDYAAHGVGEYWLVDPELRVIEQYVLRHDQYELLLKVNSGYLTSTVIADFTIPVQAIFDETQNLRALQELLMP
jgi:Uma2 family endonuclease